MLRTLAVSTSRFSFRAALLRPFSTEQPNPCRVCIIGTGPSGFYTAKYLLKAYPSAVVDMIDKLPTPFGLVRAGVAPDHPEVKSVQNDFEQVAADSRVNFLGNVAVGKDLTLEDLKAYYNAIVLAYGSESDRKLGIPGEDLKGVLSAREFVNWYNGHPDFADLNPALTTSDSAVVVGQGNVGLDCARILVKTRAELAATDISDSALDSLQSSTIKHVTVAGRRGHAQAAFTMKEVRELTRLPSSRCLVSSAELQLGRTEASQEELKQRARKRMDALLTDVAAAAEAAPDAPDSSVSLRFLLSPVEILESERKDGTVAAVKFRRTALQGEAGAQRAVDTEEEVVVDCGLVLRSIGYKAVPMEGVPFDHLRHIVPNVLGRVITAAPDADAEDSTVAEAAAAPTTVPGLYCVGWLKRGPSGIIGSNIIDAKETVSSLTEDALAAALPAAGLPGVTDYSLTALPAVSALLATRGKRDGVSWDEYMNIDAVERTAGAASGKPRAKLTDVQEMVKVARTPSTVAAAAAAAAAASSGGDGDATRSNDDE